MEISKSGENSIKIKTKTVTIVTDPKDETPAEVIIFTTPNFSYTPAFPTKLVITGAGEYEVGGVAIKGEQHGQETLFKIYDQSKIMLLPSTLAVKTKGEDDFDALIMKINQKVDKNLLSVSGSDTLVLYGNEGEIPEGSEVKKMNKINLKKKEDITGFVIYLG